jgi:HEAT repeat protein
MAHPETQKIIEKLKDPDPRVRDSAAEEAGCRSVREAIPHLIPLLWDTNAGVRASAVFAVANCAEDLYDISETQERQEMKRQLEELAIPRLQELLSDSDGEVRAWTISGLLWLRRGNIAAPLIPLLLDDEYGRVRLEAVKYLGSCYYDEKTFLKLRQMLKDPDRQVRREVVKIMRRLQENFRQTSCLSSPSQLP